MPPAILYGSMGPDSQAIDIALEQAVGRKQSLVHLALAWANGRKPDGTPNYLNFPQPMLQFMWDRGSLVLLDWDAWDFSNRSDPVFGYDRIAAGDHDAFLHTFAQVALSWGKAVLIRFDAEMNGQWEPYWGQPDHFVQAWRHIVDIFRAEHALNVAWHWCPNVTAPAGTQWTTAADKLSAYYPGDDYVDWTGFDTYNWSTGNGGPWMSFDQIVNGYPGWLGPTYDTIAKLAPSKPMCLGEFGCWDDPLRKPGWILDALQSLPSKYPLVRAISYFNWPSDGAKWPIGPDSVGAFAQGISSSAYVHGGAMEMPANGASLTPYESRQPRPEPSHPDVAWPAYAQLAAILGQEQAIRRSREAELDAVRRGLVDLRTFAAKPPYT